MTDDTRQLQREEPELINAVLFEAESRPLTSSCLMSNQLCSRPLSELEKNCHASAPEYYVDSITGEVYPVVTVTTHHHINNTFVTIRYKSAVSPSQTDKNGSDSLTLEDRLRMKSKQRACVHNQLRTMSGTTPETPFTSLQPETVCHEEKWINSRSNMNNYAKMTPFDAV